MTILALLRHAKAVGHDAGGDHARPLTEGGREAATAAGRRLRRLLPPDVVVIASDARRTRQTAELAFPAGEASHLRIEPSLYAALPGDILATVRGLPEEHPAVVLVGHNPGLSELAAVLAGRGEAAELARLSEGLATADAVILDFAARWGAVAPQTGRLVALLARADAED